MGQAPASESVTTNAAKMNYKYKILFTTIGLGLAVLLIGACTYPYHKLKELSSEDKFIRMDLTLSIDGKIVNVSDVNKCVIRAVGFSGKDISHTVWTEKRFYASRILADNSAIVSYFPDCDEALPHEYHPWVVRVDDIDRFNCYDYYHPWKNGEPRHQRVKLVSAVARRTTPEDHASHVQSRDQKIEKLYNVMFEHTQYMKYDFRTLVAWVYHESEYALDPALEKKLPTYKVPTRISGEIGKRRNKRFRPHAIGLVPEGNVWKLNWDNVGYERWCDLKDHPYLRTGKVYMEEVNLPARFRIGNTVLDAKQKGFVYVPEKKSFVLVSATRYGYGRVTVRHNEKTGSIDYGDFQNEEVRVP